MIAQRYHPVFAAFALADVRAFFKIHICQPDISDFHTPQSAAIQQADEHLMFEQLALLEHLPYFLLAQYGG